MPPSRTAPTSPKRAPPGPRSKPCSTPKFLDETWATTNMTRTHGRAPRAERLVAAVPHGHWHTTTFLSGLRHDGLIAPLVFENPVIPGSFKGDEKANCSAGQLWRVHSRHHNRHPRLRRRFGRRCSSGSSDGGTARCSRPDCRDHAKVWGVQAAAEIGPWSFQSRNLVRPCSFRQITAAQTAYILHQFCAGK